MNQFEILLEEKQNIKCFDKEKSLDVIVYENFEDLASMQEEWDGFMESIRGEIFLTYDWCRVWWKYYGKNRDLKIFILRHDQKLVGILPVFLENLRLGLIRVKVIKMVGTDFTPISITFPVERDFIDEAVEKFINELSRQCNWDILHIGAICGRYESIEILLKTAKSTLNHFYQIEVKDNEVQTYFELANSWEEQIASLSQRQRTKTRRIYKEIQKQGVKINSFFASEESLSRMFDNFVKLHQSHWQSLGLAGHFGDWPSSYDFHREIAGIQFNYDRLRLLEIQLDDQPIGYEYIYKLGDTYYWFLSARCKLEKDSHIDFHRVAFKEKVEKALKDNVKLIDGMRGHYEYKLVMGGQLKPIHTILAYSKKPFPFLRISMLRSLIWLLNILYLKIWRRRIVPRLKIKPKPFQDWWIKSHMLSY